MVVIDRAQPNLSLETLLGQVAEEFFERQARGEQPQIDEYIQKYPAIAEDIRRAFPALALVRQTSSCTSGSGQMVEVGCREALGDFLIVHEIGRGGMGIVYEAEQRSMGRRVALKILPFATLVNATALRRFKNEVRAAATLTHPNIVSVYSVGEERGIHFYAMQLVRGQSVATVIDDLRQLTGDGKVLDVESMGQTLRWKEDLSASNFRSTISDDPGTAKTRSSPDTQPLATAPTPSNHSGRVFYRSVANLGIQAAQALHYAHEQGVVHRDIKPANLMIDANNTLYVTDFGLARIEADAGLSMTGDLVGTVRYMAPEQALAKRVMVDHRVDIYSLAATLYELLTMRPVFDGVDRHELLQQIAFEDPTPLRRHSRQIPIELETILLKGLAKNPDERYPTAQEMANDLQRFLDDKPIHAKPPSLWKHASKWSRRNRVMLVSCMITLIASLGVSTAMLWQAHRRTTAALQTASSNLQTARAVVDDMYVELAEQWIKEKPYLTKLQRGFLEKAAKFYQTLPVSHDTDAETLRQTALVQYRLGEIQCTMGQTAVATESYRRSVAIYDSLVKEGVAHESDTKSLAKALAQLGVHCITCSIRDGTPSHDHPEMTAMGRDALERAKQMLAPSLSGDIEAQQSLAHVCYGLASLHKRLGQLDQAEGLTKQGLDLLSNSLDRDPGNAELQTRLVQMLSMHAEILSDFQREEAEQVVRQAIAIGEAVAESHPMKTLNLLLLSSNLNRLGILLRQVHNNDVSLSIPIWERAAEVTDDLTRQFPDLPESFEHSILVHNNLSLAYRDPNTEDLAKAVLHKKKVVELARVMLGRHPHLGEHYQMVDYLSDLAEVLEKANCPEESRESFRGAQREMRKIVQDAQRDVERLPDDEVKHYVLVWTLSRYAKFSRLAGDEDTAAKTEQRVQSLLEQQSKVIQAAQRGVDDSPEDDQKRLKLFHALFDHARLSELAENSQTAEFQERAELELTRMSAAPDIEGEDLAGRIFKLSEYKGKVVVLDFFADWCGWCRKMYPKQRQLVQAYEGRPFALLGVNVDSPQALEEVVRQKAVTWRCWVDGNSIAPVWRVCGYPTVFLIDHRGIVRKRFVGVEEENVEFSKEFSETLEQLVREAEHARETG